MGYWYSAAFTANRRIADFGRATEAYLRSVFLLPGILVKFSLLEARMAIKAKEVFYRSWKVCTLNKMSLV